MPQNKLIIFVKNEEAGKVKTRLAKSVGNEKALEIYRKLLGYTFDQVQPLKVIKEVCYSRFIEEDDLWNEGSYSKQLQEGDVLGERMSKAFKRSFEKGMERVVIIGSDCAELTTDILREVFSRLKDHDIVIGPAGDGGYYLLGMSKFISELFTDISWSTGAVLEQTLKKADEENATYYKLQELHDVDIEADWELVKHKFEPE
jgi:rSAM/selenodomain-associated transferase 1